jgi:hypothetical protein
MLYRNIITVGSQIFIQHINTLCGQNVEFFNVKPGGTYSYHYALKRCSDFRFLFSSVSTKIFYAFNTLIMRAACRSVFPTKIMKHCRRLRTSLLYPTLKRKVTQIKTVAFYRIYRGQLGTDSSSILPGRHEVWICKFCVDSR